MKQVGGGAAGFGLDECEWDSCRMKLTTLFLMEGIEFVINKRALYLFLCVHQQTSQVGAVHGHLLTFSLLPTEQSFTATKSQKTVKFL